MYQKSIYSYKDLIVWQRSMDLVIAVYELTEKFPRSELYILAAHTRRTAISIASNIAEGKRRSTTKDYRHFLNIAYSSGAELETQIEISKRLPFGKNLLYEKVDMLLLQIMKMLNKLIANLRSPHSSLSPTALPL